MKLKSVSGSKSSANEILAALVLFLGVIKVFLKIVVLLHKKEAKDIFHVLFLHNVQRPIENL